MRTNSLIGASICHCYVTRMSDTRELCGREWVVVAARRPEVCVSRPDTVLSSLDGRRSVVDGCIRVGSLAQLQPPAPYSLGEIF